MGETIKAFCYNCQCETNQKLLFNKNEFITPEYIAYDAAGKRGQSVWTVECIIWNFTECQGCEKTNLNVFKRHDPAQPDIAMHQFPQKLLRDIPYWISYLHRKYIDLFGEIYSSLNAGHIRLPLMGIRTLLDMYITEKIGDVGTFKAKLNKLVEEKIIPAHQ